MVDMLAILASMIMNYLSGWCKIISEFLVRLITLNIYSCCDWVFHLLEGE